MWGSDSSPDADTHRAAEVKRQRTEPRSVAKAWRFGLVFQDLCDHGSESRWALDTRVGEAGGLGSKERWAPGLLSVFSPAG